MRFVASRYDAALQKLRAEVVAKEDGIKPKDWILWLLAAAMTIALLLIAPKLTSEKGGIVVLALLVAMYFCLIIPLPHVGFLSHSKSLIWIVRVLVLIVVGSFGWYVWPEPEFRALPLDVQVKLAVELKPHPGPGTVVIEVVGEDQETYRYARQFEDVFLQAGWNATTRFLMRASPPEEYAAVIVRGKSGGPQDDAVFVDKIFTKYDIKHSSRVPDIPPNPHNVEIEIWPKRQW